MTTLNRNYTPLMQVPSADLNRWQTMLMTQRGAGNRNSLATGLDTNATTHMAKEIVFAMDNTSRTPPVDGLIDNTMDWRDRILTGNLAFDPSLDIRPGEADDGKQPLILTSFTIYSNVGNRVWAVGALQTFGLYVDNTDGFLWIKKPAGYVYGTVRASCQIKERS